MHTSDELAASRVPLTHDGDERTFHVGPNTLCLRRNSVTDFRVVALDYRGLLLDPAYARNFPTETAARDHARWIYCQLAGRTPKAPVTAPARAPRITVVENPSVWASRGLGDRDHTITTLKALIQQTQATTSEQPRAASSAVALLDRPTMPAEAPAPSAPVEWAPAEWRGRARAGTRLWVTIPGLKVLLLALSQGGWANSVREFNVQTCKALLDREMVVSMRPVTTSGQWGRQLDATDMDVVVTRIGAACALKELAAILNGNDEHLKATFAKYANLLPAVA